MRVQTHRTDPQPIGWEIPAAGAAAWLLTAALVLPAAQGAACWLFSGGFVWPHGSLVESITGLLRGRPGDGLSATQLTHLATTPSVYLLVVVGEVTLLVVVLAAVSWWWRTVGPGAQHGMASRTQVQAVLGRSQLHKRRRIIRPDKYGTTAIRRGDR